MNELIDEMQGSSSTKGGWVHSKWQVATDMLGTVAAFSLGPLVGGAYGIASYLACEIGKE